MNDIQTNINSLLQITNDIEFKINELNKLGTQYDREINDIIHYIEFNKFSASKGYWLSKQLKEVRINRRNNHNEVELLLEMKTYLSNTTIKKMKLAIETKISIQNNRKYTNRTNVLER